MLFVILLFFVSVQGGFTNWDLAVLPGKHIPTISAGIFNRGDNPLIGNHEPFISFHLGIKDKRKDQPPKTLPVAEAVIYHHTLKRDIGVPADLLFRNEYCCTKNLYDTGVCSNLGRMLITNLTFLQQQHPSKFQYYSLSSLSMLPGGQATNFSGKVTVFHTGVWYFMVANCDDTDTKSPLEVTGVVEIMNPYGYLPGQIATKLPVFWTLTVAYLLLFVVYSILMCVFRHDLMGLQYATALVIFFGFLEAIILSGGFAYFNFHGYYSPAQPAIGALAIAIKSTALRTLLLLVGLGLSIVKDRLGLFTILTMTLMVVVYFMFECMTQFIIIARAAGDPYPSLYQSLVSFGTLITNSAFLSWIVVATYITMTQLEEQKQTAKAKQYQTLGTLIVVALFLSFFVLLIQAALTSTRYADENFKWMWLWDAYWHFVNFACIFTIAMLWRPSGNNKAYAYSDQLPQDDPGNGGAGNFPRYPNEADNDNSESSSEVRSNSEPNVSLEESTRDDKDIPLEPLGRKSRSTSSSTDSDINESSV